MHLRYLGLGLFVTLGGCLVQQPQPVAPQTQPQDQAQPGPAPAAHTQPATASSPIQYQASQQQVTINRVAIPAEVLTRLAGAGLPLPTGDYWYDKACGAFGQLGKPTAFFIMANLELGGPLPADASNGNTQVAINGRWLTTSEVNYLTALVQTPIQPGRYWLDGAGNAGVEGQPAIVNLLQLANRQQSAGKSKFHRGWGGTYSSDGSCYYISTGSGSVMGPNC
jgi:hypothetical protein